MSKRVVKLQGGLGNQMFQYAFGQAQRTSFGESVLYDISWFDEVKKKGKMTLRNYELDVFLANVPLIDEPCVSNLLYGRLPLISWMRRRFHKNLHLIRERDAHEYREEFLTTRGDIYYDGCFQNENYFTSIRSQLLHDFELREPLNSANDAMLEKIRKVHAVSLHVRRGDYLTTNRLSVCPLDYYHHAMEWIAQHVENPHFFIFSDDPLWVAEHLSCNYTHTLVDLNGSHEGYYDLELMKNCKHQIIANSTFSWWGAWLNQNPDKMIIAPTSWYADPSRQSDGLLPSQWRTMA
ncbi:MAG: alpha-1,2-fucosyltransferase [Akkermansia sp.]